MDIKKVALAIFVIISAIGIAFSAWPQENSNQRQRENMTDIDSRGKQLRTEIDSVYKKLSDAHAIKNNGMGRNFITDVVVKYIPTGTSFDEAEAILRAAGFTVSPHRPNPHITEGNPDKYAVTATIDQYAPTPFGKTSIDVYLFPRSPNDYSIVQKITAEITRTLL